MSGHLEISTARHLLPPGFQVAALHETIGAKVAGQEPFGGGGSGCAFCAGCACRHRLVGDQG